MRVAGLAEIADPKERALDLTVSTPLPGLPLPRALKSQGTFCPTGGETGPANARKPFTISGPVAEAKLCEDGVPLATGSMRFGEDRKPIFTGLMGRQSGNGIALFATHPLWQYWPLADPLSQALHEGLLMRRAQFELVQPGLLPGTVQMSGNPDNLLLLNLARQPATAQVRAYAAAGRAWLNAIANFNAAPVQEGYPSGTVSLVAAVSERDVARLSRLPLVVQPHTGDLTVQVLEYSPQRIELKVCGTSAIIGGSPGRGLYPHGGIATETRMLLTAGTYAVAPRSRHQVTLKTRGGQESKAVLTASERGELDLSGRYREDTITVVPAPSM
jgi:hypothetical protein